MTSFLDDKTKNLFTLTSVANQQCDSINNSIKQSKYAELFSHMNESVKQVIGPKYQVNWRWLDLNLFLSELKLHEFGTVDWYDDIDNGKKDPRRDLTSITKTFIDLQSPMKVMILKKSVIEDLDSMLAAHKQNDAMTHEQRGDYGAAIKDYDGALDLDPHCVKMRRLGEF